MSEFLYRRPDYGSWLLPLGLVDSEPLHLSPDEEERVQPVLQDGRFLAHVSGKTGLLTHLTWCWDLAPEDGRKAAVFFEKSFPLSPGNSFPKYEDVEGAAFGLGLLPGTYGKLTYRLDQRVQQLRRLHTPKGARRVGEAGMLKMRQECRRLEIEILECVDYVWNGVLKEVKEILMVWVVALQRIEEDQCASDSSSKGGLNLTHHYMAATAYNLWNLASSRTSLAYLKGTGCWREPFGQWTSHPLSKLQGARLEQLLEERDRVYREIVPLAEELWAYRTLLSFSQRGGGRRSRHSTPEQLTDNILKRLTDKLVNDYRGDKSAKYLPYGPWIVVMAERIREENPHWTTEHILDALSEALRKAHGAKIEKVYGKDTEIQISRIAYYRYRKRFSEWLPKPKSKA